MISSSQMLLTTLMVLSATLASSNNLVSTHRVFDILRYKGRQGEIQMDYKYKSEFASWINRSIFTLKVLQSFWLVPKTISLSLHIHNCPTIWLTCYTCHNIKWLFNAVPALTDISRVQQSRFFGPGEIILGVNLLSKPPKLSVEQENAFQ